MFKSSFCRLSLWFQSNFFFLTSRTVFFETKYVVFTCSFIFSEFGFVMKMADKEGGETFDEAVEERVINEEYKVCLYLNSS